LRNPGPPTGGYDVWECRYCLHPRGCSRIPLRFIQATGLRYSAAEKGKPGKPILTLALSLKERVSGGAGILDISHKAR